MIQLSLQNFKISLQKVQNSKFCLPLLQVAMETHLFFDWFRVLFVCVGGQSVTERPALRWPGALGKWGQLTSGV